MKFSWLLIPPVALVFIVFFKIGLVFFGGGYVVIPVIHRELVTNLHLLTEQEFIDGTALSQLTPGPIAMIATFAGYGIAGFWGGLVGTFAMFLPGSSLMFTISKNYEKIKNSKTATKILNTAIPAVVGLLISASFNIGKSVIDSYAMAILFVIAAIALIKYKANPVVLIAITALIGVAFHL